MRERNVQGVSQGSGDVMIKSAKVSCFLEFLKAVLPVLQKLYILSKIIEA